MRRSVLIVLLVSIALIGVYESFPDRRKPERVQTKATANTKTPNSIRGGVCKKTIPKIPITQSAN